MSSAGFGGGEGEDGAEAFSTGEDGVAHGFVDGAGCFGDFGEEVVKSVVDQLLLALQVSFEFWHVLNDRENSAEGNMILREFGFGVSWGVSLKSIFVSAASALSLSADPLAMGADLPVMKGVNQGGEEVVLGAGAGEEWVLIFTYPKAGTYG